MKRPTMLLTCGFAVCQAMSPAKSAAIVGGPIVVSSTADVIATFIGANANLESQLSLVGGPSNIFDNKISAIGSVYNLGSFAVGTVLTFSIYVVNTKNTFYSGAASLNPDGVAHASVEPTSGGTIVGFEDIFNGGDRDYNDLRFTFSNTATPGVPEAASWAMFLVGFGMLGRTIRQRRTSVSFA